MKNGEFANIVVFSLLPLCMQHQRAALGQLINQHHSWWWMGTGFVTLSCVFCPHHPCGSAKLQSDVVCHHRKEYVLP